MKWNSSSLVCLLVLASALLGWYWMLYGREGFGMLLDGSENYVQPAIASSKGPREHEGSGVNPGVQHIQSPEDMPPGHVDLSSVEFVPGVEDLEVIPPVEYGAGTIGFGRYPGMA